MSTNKNTHLTREKYINLCNETRSKRKALFYTINKKIGLCNLWTSNKKPRFIAYNLSNCESNKKYNTIKFDSNIANQDGFLTNSILEEILNILNTMNNGYKLIENSKVDLRWFKDDRSPYLQFKQFNDYKKKY